MTPGAFYEHIVAPTLDWMSACAEILIPVSEAALIEVLAIAGQESNWQYRTQIGGPARSYWQFEEGGGVVGVLGHPASASKIKAVCNRLDIPCDAPTVYEAMAWNDVLACAMARLLLLTDPAPLPTPGNEAGAWECYQQNWRPGAPHPEAWHGVYGQASALVRNGWKLAGAP